MGKNDNRKGDNNSDYHKEDNKSDYIRGEKSANGCRENIAANCKKAADYIAARQQEMVEGLFPLLRQPSISTRNQGIPETVEFLEGEMRELGIETRVIPTAGNPVVYGEIGPDSGKTVLIYGHYDVQPPEPLEEWDSPPFEPEIRQNRIFARGASDNKGQLYAHLMAVKTLKELKIWPELKLKFIFEGEEETGSPNLESFVRENRELLASDLSYMSDAHIHQSLRPLIVLGLKGMVSIELIARGANRDLHSAMADIVQNPAWRLIWALASLKEAPDEVKVEGFYEDIRDLSPGEREYIARIPLDKEEHYQDLGIESFLPRAEREFYQARTRPTFNISGLSAGYTGEGSKSVLPAEARAKLDIRLTADQNPEKIVKMVRRHLADKGFGDLEVKMSAAYKPSFTDPSHPLVEQVIEAVRSGFDREPIIYPRILGSGPDYVFTDILKNPSVIVPYGWPDQETHAPNENMSIEGYLTGIRTSAFLFLHLAGERG